MVVVVVIVVTMEHYSLYRDEITITELDGTCQLPPPPPISIMPSTNANPHPTMYT